MESHRRYSHSLGHGEIQSHSQLPSPSPYKESLPPSFRKEETLNPSLQTSSPQLYLSLKTPHFHSHSDLPVDMPPKKSPAARAVERPELPDPTTDILKSMHWMSMEHPEFLSVENRVLHNNLEVIARLQTSILVAVRQSTTDRKPRSRSGSSRQSGATEVAEDEQEEDLEAVLTMEDSSQEQEALRGQLQEYDEMIKKFHGIWIAESEVILYLHYNKGLKAKTDAGSRKPKGKSAQPQRTVSTVGPTGETDRSSYSPQPVVFGSPRGQQIGGESSRSFSLPRRGLSSPAGGMIAVAAAGSQRKRTRDNRNIVQDSEEEEESPLAKVSKPRVTLDDEIEDNDD
ncbi:Fc.00g054560.m01.CDS01 [Cosmosporella sp. VM-42]